MGANDLSLMMVEFRQYFENFKEMNKTSDVSARGGVCPGGVCQGEVWQIPPVNSMTDRCKNITDWSTP